MKKFKGIEVDEDTVRIEKVCNNFYIYDENYNEIYRENSDGYWAKREYDENNGVVYYEDSLGYYASVIYDKNSNMLFRETSNGFWEKHEYDENNNEVYYEDSTGVIIDSRKQK